MIRPPAATLHQTSRPAEGSEPLNWNVVGVLDPVSVSVESLPIQITWPRSCAESRSTRAMRWPFISMVAVLLEGMVRTSLVSQS